MKRLKLVLPAKLEGAVGLDAKLLDADTGEELDCAGDIQLLAPLDGLLRVQVTFVLAEIELR